MPITVIAFDLGNVLIKVDHFRFCRRLARLAGISPEEVFDRVFNSDLEPDFDTGRICPPEFYQGIASRFHLDLLYPQFCQWWNDVFDPMPGMEELVIRLKDKYPLFLLSNTNALHFPYIFNRFPLVHHCRRFILSYEVGSRKPEPEIYQALIRATGQPPRDCLYLDDKLPLVDAARGQGLEAWHFTSPQDFRRYLELHGLW